MKVYLLRHGIAVPHHTPGIAEAERPLTSEGISKLKKSAKGMKHLKLEWDEIYSSPYHRACQTAALAAKGVKHKKAVQILDALLPSSSPETLEKFLKTFPKEGSILLVGHEPHLGMLLGRWISGGKGVPIPLKKGALCEIEYSPASHHGLLRWILTSKLLAKLA